MEFPKFGALAQNEWLLAPFCLKNSSIVIPISATLFVLRQALKPQKFGSNLKAHCLTRSSRKKFLYMEVNPDSFWKKCSSCKKPIAFGAKYYICSVSTCSGQRTGYVFCSMPCFEVHLPAARHRDAGGIQKIAPLTQAAASPSASLTGSSEASDANSPVRRKIVTGSPGINQASSSAKIPRDILIVASKLKDYIHARSEMNTSATVMEVLSDIVRRACDEAIDQARGEGRKTVLDRDFKKS